MIRTLTLAALLRAAALPVSAGSAEGIAAYNKGHYREAYRELTAPAERGDAKAQFNVGLMYDNGQGVTQDYVQAHMWFNLAGAQGVKQAAKNRDMGAKLMTPAQIAEAQRLASEWMAAFEKRKKK